ncbi:MAG: protease modulator HflC [Magnetococcales bacterium]|nr:protease modulator HflC [Magnetococcales bacterium]
MKTKLSSGMLGIIVAALIVLSQSVYTVHEIEQAIVIQLGKSVGEPNTKAGLYFKVPLIQEVHKFDKRLLVFDQDPQEILSSDKKNLKVDNYARWRITDPLTFYQTVRNEAGGSARLNDIIYSNIREVLGQSTMMEIVAGTRDELRDRIRSKASLQAANYGIEIVDVRIKRTDLPPENSKAVFKRMQTERERQAMQYRAQGQEEAVKIRAEADREREVVLAEAYRKAQELRGNGDAESTRIYAEAITQDEKFYKFKRTMEAYGKVFAEDTTVVLEPSGFFKYLKGPDAN